MILLKLGKKEHLEQLLSGKIRFMPAEHYINEEKKTGTSGIGDINDSLINISELEVELRIPNTNAIAKGRLNGAMYVNCSEKKLIFCCILLNTDNCKLVQDNICQIVCKITFDDYRGKPDRAGKKKTKK